MVRESRFGTGFTIYVGYVCNKCLRSKHLKNYSVKLRKSFNLKFLITRQLKISAFYFCIIVFKTFKCQGFKEHHY